MRRAGAIGVVALVTVAISLVGSGADAAPVAPHHVPSAASSGSVRGVTDKTIKVVGICPVTSPTGGYPGCDVGAKARFEAANKAGGINGRKIDYIGTKDDNENGTKNLDLSHEAVEKDQVFAVVPELGQGFLPASSNYFNEQQVPSVGWGFMPGQCAGPDTYGFGFNGCIVPPGAATVNTSVAAPFVDKIGKHKAYALVSDDTTTSTSGLKLVTAAYKAVGADVDYSKSNVPTSDNDDYTPFIQDIMTSNDGKAPDAVVFNGRFQNTVGLTGGLKAAGFTGAMLNYITYVPGLLDKSPDAAQALNGSYVMTQFLAPEFGGKAISQMKSAIKAVDPKAPILLGTALSYWSADVFVQMLQAAGKDLTPEIFGTTINGGWTYKPYGNPIGIGPVTYPKDHTEASPCADMLRISGTKYKPVTPMTCYKNVPLTSVAE
jgi:ABC-type branched-subunit amino acid transport system substrate-binding protein